MYFGHLATYCVLLNHLYYLLAGQTMFSVDNLIICSLIFCNLTFLCLICLTGNGLFWSQKTVEILMSGLWIFNCKMFIPFRVGIVHECWTQCKNQWKSSHGRTYVEMCFWLAPACWINRLVGCCLLDQPSYWLLFVWSVFWLAAAASNPPGIAELAQAGSTEIQN
jgi:hypothetical protein